MISYILISLMFDLGGILWGEICCWSLLNTKARYIGRGALGTSGSFVTQPSWHTELQNSLSCSQCKALTRGAFLGKFLRFHHNGRIFWGLYYLPPIETFFICGGKFEIRNDSLRHRLKLPWRNFMSVSKYWM